MTLRILDIAEVTKPIASPIRNAYIDFSKMTTSLVAVTTNLVRNGKPVVGYGFNSNGRYGQGGLIRERFRACLLEAEPKSLLDATGDNLDPGKCWAALMTNEKPGGHGERSVAVGTIDMAIWDAVAKIADTPLFRLLAEREGRTADPKVSRRRSSFSRPYSRARRNSPFRRATCRDLCRGSNSRQPHRRIRMALKSSLGAMSCLIKAPAKGELRPTPSSATLPGCVEKLTKGSHVRNDWSQAEMPFMQRLTWSGIALHAGALPGYPASHGCIRMPYDFAGQLFEMSKSGPAGACHAGRHEPRQYYPPGALQTCTVPSRGAGNGRRPAKNPAPMMCVSPLSARVWACNSSSSFA